MIETARLRLRAWREEDRAPFAAMSRSPQVMEHMGGLLDRNQSDAAVDRMIACQDAVGHCFWAIERRTDGAFLGLCGLKPGVIGTIKDEVEIGWRLRADAWGAGFAFEAASASLAWGWTALAVSRIVAITVPANRRSWRLMDRLGMVRRDELDFDHPLFPPGHALRKHIAYAIERPAEGAAG